MNLNIAAGLAFCLFLWAAIWTLTARSRSATSHAKAAQKTAQAEKTKYKDFIDAKMQAKVEMQKLSAS